MFTLLLRYRFPSVTMVHLVDVRYLQRCYGFEQQQRSDRASRNRSRNRTAVCEYI